MTVEIITNNPKVQAFYANSQYPLTFIEGDAEAVYTHIEKLLQTGYELVTSPLPANVPTIRSSVRSILIRKGERRVDGEGLMLMDNARERVRTLSSAGHRAIDLDDLRMIDLDQLRRAFTQL